jgi:hypothetical protein
MSKYHEIQPRDDGWFDVVSGDTIAGPFPTVRFALQIASGERPTPAPVANFRRLKIVREVRRDASA